MVKRSHLLIAIGVIGSICLIALMSPLLAFSASGFCLFLGAMHLVKKLLPETPYTLKIESEGKVLVLLTVGLGFAAVNTGSNLLYLLLGTLLSLIVVSGIYSQRNLQKLKLTYALPPHVRAEQTTLIEVSIVNQKTKFHSRYINLEKSSDGCKILGTGCVDVIPATGTRRLARHMIFPQRGAFKLSNFSQCISTSFPFGFFTKTKKIRTSAETTVLPKRVYLSPSLLAELSRFTTKTIHGQTADFAGLKPYQPGDDHRRVDWKRSTISQQQWLRTFDRESAGTSKVNVICSEGSLDEIRAEYWISFAATLVEECHRANLDIHFKCGAFETIIEARSTTVLPILLFLAQLDPHTLQRTPDQIRTDFFLVDLNAHIPVESR